MRYTYKLLLGIVLVIGVAVVLTAKQPLPETTSETEHEETSDHQYVTSGELAELPSADLSEQEITDLIHMRQEEKLARDVYRTLGQSYKVQQFENIPVSEQKHTDAIELLLARYDITDPIVDEDSNGVYQDSQFNNLYTTLVDQGSTSLVEALRVGATVEDMNMAKLQEVIANTDNEDISYVYTSLLSQSRHHMQAFTRGLTSQGAQYTPKYIDQNYYDQVIAAGSSKGNGNQGHGGGANKG